MGLFDFIKGAFKGESSRSDSGEAGFTGIMNALYAEVKEKNANWYAIKLQEYKTVAEQLLPLPDKQKIAFLLYAINAIDKYHRTTAGHDQEKWIKKYITDATLRYLLKTKLSIDEEDFISLAENFMSHTMYGNGTLTEWPVGLLLNQAEKQWKQHGQSASARQTLQQMRAKLDAQKIHSHEKDRVKLLEKIDSLLFQPGSAGSTVKPTFFPGADGFARYANEQLQQMPETSRDQWFRLMQLAQKASGAKPSQKYLDEAKNLFKELGADAFKKVANGWIEFIVRLKETEETHQYEYGGQQYSNTSYEFIALTNTDIIKGFVWMCVHFHDKATLFNLASLAERAYRKIPGKGPAAPAIGNAALYVLANSKGLDGVGHLSRLKLRIKQSSTQALIDKYLAEAAASQGVSVHEVEDMAVDDHGLVNGKKEYDFDGFKAILEITGIGKTELRWFKPDGSPQKSVPALVKEKHAAKLKKLKDTVKQVELTLTAQRDRLDRMFKSDRVFSAGQFEEHYLQHGLMSFITRRMIWNVEQDGIKQAVILQDGNWVNEKGQALFTSIKEEAAISPWHPVSATLDEVKAWREFILENQLTQPLKQAFREVYLLTEAEINTRVYSNRMAAHVLKQHQFNSLAKTRGWKYSLLGAYDDGRSGETASILLPDHQLRAEFWVTEINAENAFNDTGIWLYVSTDQVRFINTQNNETVELIHIPPVVLSEVMRDADLFVGVASVGNDPAWRDNGGLPAYRDYWQSYSFGDLTEVAKTRKAILERLVPRLKIAPVTAIKDKFLVVKGKLRTYKIHLGSTNILMEPNDQYLCIVPDRSQPAPAEKLFIPFEGDNGLSVILSKAFLLAADDTITDSTITRQINGR